MPASGTFKITYSDIEEISSVAGLPCYFYDQPSLEQNCRELLAFPHAYGFTGRFAMKACPIKKLLQIVSEAGVHIDASSGYEVERAIRAGIPPENIQLTSQAIPDNLESLLELGISYNACSLHQMENYGRLRSDSNISFRVNPGKGSGHSAKVVTGGPDSSFGIWYEKLSEVIRIADKYRLKITGLHSHIGAGTDPVVWNECAKLTLGVAEKLPDVTTVNVGGGFKVARYPGETNAPMDEIGQRLLETFQDFYKKTGRKLHLELEPGTFMMANAGAIIGRVIDIVDTGENGRRFIKVNTGMNENLRVGLYDAKHPIEFVSRDGLGEKGHFQVVGRCCETGDVLTNELREFSEPKIGDAIIIRGAGAYCDAMSAVGYNSYPHVGAFLKTSEGALELMRKPQTFDQLLQNEI